MNPNKERSQQDQKSNASKQQQNQQQNVKGNHPGSGFSKHSPSDKQSGEKASFHQDNQKHRS